MNQEQAAAGAMSGKRPTPSSGNVFADLGLPHAEQLLGSADKLCAMLDALRLAYTALKEAEWSAMGSGSQPDMASCPDCRNWPEQGHAADCDLAAALAAIRALLPDVGGEEG
jgi:hypothetical protein